MLIGTAFDFNKRRNILFCFMKNFSVLTALVALLLISSCSNQNENEASTTAAQDSLIETPKVAPPEELMPLISLNGQYPIEVGFLDNPLIKSRLEKLMGADYANFRKYWSVETPIIVEDNVLSTTGCEQHNCAANQYILQIDLKNDNINIIHFSEKMKSYEEKGEIILPNGLAKDFAIMKTNSVY